MVFRPFLIPLTPLLSSRHGTHIMTASDIALAISNNSEQAMRVIGVVLGYSGAAMLSIPRMHENNVLEAMYLTDLSSNPTIPERDANAMKRLMVCFCGISFVVFVLYINRVIVTNSHISPWSEWSEVASLYGIPAILFLYFVRIFFFIRDISPKTLRSATEFKVAKLIMPIPNSATGVQVKQTLNTAGTIMTIMAVSLGLASYLLP